MHNYKKVSNLKKKKKLLENVQSYLLQVDNLLYKLCNVLLSLIITYTYECFTVQSAVVL